MYVGCVKTIKTRFEGMKAYMYVCMVWYGVVWYRMIHMVWYGTVGYGMVWYGGM